MIARVPTGLDKLLTRRNVGRWLLAYGTGTAHELASQAARAFGVDDLLSDYQPGEHWIWDVAAQVAKVKAAKGGK